jgi:D-apiose dehydrogenase
MTDLRFAVFGAGFWARFQIAAWFEVGGAKPVAICNRTVSRAEALAQQFNIPRVYSDAEDLYRNEQLDFVDIITEVPAHAPLVALAAQYRTPVICQKPMGPDYQTCVRMVAACRDAGVPFMIHENFRWMASMRAAKQLLQEGRCGVPYRARFQLWHGTKEQLDNQPFLKTLERWALTDMGSHAFDLARFFFGEPESVYCLHLRSGIAADALGEDVASVVLKIGSTICELDFGYRPDPMLVVEGDRGTLEMLASGDLIAQTDRGSTIIHPEYPVYAWADPSYGPILPAIVDTNAHLLGALKSGRPADTSGEDNLRTMRLVYAAYESAARNEVINVN